MSVWKLPQSNLGGHRARFLIGVCGQCSTGSKDLLDPNNLVPRGQYNGYVKALLLQKQAQFDTVSKKVGGSDKLGKNIGQQYCWCSLMWLMPLRSLSNCDYELNFYLRLILGPIHSNQVMGTDPVGSYHGTRNSRSNSVNPTYRYQSHD